MKVGTTIFTLAGLYGLYYVIEKMMFADKVKFEIADIKLDFDRIIPNVILTIKAINPTNVAATITNFEGQTFINDFIKIADIKLFKAVTIQPLQETKIDFAIIPDYRNIISYIKNVIDNKKGYLTIKGNAIVDGLTIPLNLKYNVA